MTTQTAQKHTIRILAQAAGVRLEACADCAAQPYRVVVPGPTGRPQIVSFYADERAALGAYQTVAASWARRPANLPCARPGCRGRLFQGVCLLCGRAS